MKDGRRKDQETEGSHKILVNMNDRDWNNGQFWNKIITTSKRKYDNRSVQKW